AVVQDLRSLENKIQEIQTQLSCFSSEEQNLFISSGVLQNLFVDLQKISQRCLTRLDATYRQRNERVFPIRSKLTPALLELMIGNQKKIRDCMQLILQLSFKDHPAARKLTETSSSAPMKSLAPIKSASPPSSSAAGAAAAPNATSEIKLHDVLSFASPSSPPPPPSSTSMNTKPKVVVSSSTPTSSAAPTSTMNLL